MTTTGQQIAAVTEIRKLFVKHFPFEDFYYIESNLLSHIAQEVTFDESRNAYVLEVLPACKVCDTTTKMLIEVPTVSGKFYLCHECKNRITSSETLALQKAHDAQK